MARSVDGTIRIDSKIDETGFNKGIGSMSKMLKPLAAAVAALFITLIGVKAVKAVASLSAEFQRLEFAAQAVGQIQGMAAEETRRLTAEIIENGIQTDVANRAYVNFARNGLDLALLPALARGAQDLNVFSAAGETSSDVLERITFGILNLNTLMLRRAGIAVDILAAEKAYGKTIGKTTQQMSVQEKRQGVLIKVLEEMKKVQGLYELSQKTAAGQMASNIRITNEFKAAIGAPLQNALFTLIKSWNTLLKSMTAAIKPGGVLHAQFVQIGAAALVLSEILASLFRAIMRLFGVSAPVKKSSESYEDMANASLDAAAGQEVLDDAIKGTEKTAKGALATFDDLNVLQKAEPAGGAGVGAEAGAGELFGINADEFIDPMEEVEAAAGAMRIKVDEFFTSIQEKFDLFTTSIEENKMALLTIIGVLISIPILLALGFGAIPIILAALFVILLIWVVSKWEELWVIIQQVAFIAWFYIKKAAKVAWEKIKEIWSKIGDFWERVWFIVKQLASIAWEGIKNAAESAWLRIKEVWGGLVEWFTSTVTQPLGEKFQSLKETLKDALVGAFESAKASIKGIINSIIYFINRMITGIVSGINSIISAANTISGLVGGTAIGYVSATYIPYLAQGAVIQPNAPFAAVLGDQKSGRNLELPESLLRKAIREESGGGGAQEITVNMPVYLDSEKIFDGQKKVQIRRGKSLLSAGVV